MDPVLPLTVAVPLVVAAGISAANPLFKERRRILDLIGIATAAGVGTLLVITLVKLGNGQKVYWFAGIRPHHGIALGIDFSVDRLNAGLGALAAWLVTASMVFSWRYFERVSTWYHALMLVFLAGMVGFCLTGDIFDLFVWFEVMGVAAYALTAYRPEEKGPIQGALNFAITNSVGAYLSLSGIALVYGRTGALNMAQIGNSIRHHPPDGLVVVAFVLILAGLLTKAAIVPFHLWLADAHAVAPTPVCVLFSGVMVELGLYGIARVYWSMFGAALANRSTVEDGLVALGTVTAVVGALYCIRERHLKRLLAFSTVSHAGLFLIGIGILSPLGLAGAGVYVIGHGLVKAALFLCVGIVLHRLGSVNETWLHGRGRPLRVTGVVFVVAAFALADLPPFALSVGAGWVGDSAASSGMLWVTAVIIASSMLVGGAVLRVAGGVFFGLGDPPPEDPDMAESASEETSETDQSKDRTPLSMIVPPVLAVIAALALGLVPHLGPTVQAGAVRFEDQSSYHATVIAGATIADPRAPKPAEPSGITDFDLLAGAGTAAGSVILALASLYRRRLPVIGRRPEPDPRFVGIVQAFQSGVVNDYVTWMILGLACFGGALAASIR